MGTTFTTTEAETARLIRESNGRPLRLTFPGGRLIDCPGNVWAMRLLVAWREAEKANSNL